MTIDKTTVLETTFGKRGDGDTFTLQCAWGDLPANAQERIIRYGFQRIFNDRVGGSDKTLDDKVTAATEMLEAFKRGEVHAVRASGGDPVLDEMRKLALNAWIAAKDSDKRKAQVKAMDADERVAGADKVIAAQPDEWREELRNTAETALKERAKAREAKRKAAEKVKSGLGDLSI